MGHDFGEYRRIASLRTRFPGAAVLCVTANRDNDRSDDVDADSACAARPSTWLRSTGESHLSDPFAQPAALRVDTWLRARPDEDAASSMRQDARMPPTAEALTGAGIPALAYHPRLDAVTRRNARNVSS